MLCLRRRSFVLLSLGFIFVSAASAQDEPPRSTDSRLKIELYAESPQIVTPTGIDVDRAGRVWAIESNTHFPPEGYKGHPTDRILVMEGRDKDGRVEKITVFKDGLTHTMSVAVKPVWLDVGPATEKKSASGNQQTPLEVYLATRREIFLCTDTDGDLKCDDVKRLVHLETAGNYPHNGLAGFAFDAMGNMFFGFGENLGADYKIIGSDGVTLSGGGEGGNIYRCRPDGSKLERWATGFWNPHASCIDAYGQMFSLDNDPDSRPPCRLLHIIEGGDYGYRFRNGRKGTHPFTAWNGEIPGTLPMVSGTGEAPSGIVSYESEGFPKDYIGTLLVGSWGDHRIDKFVLKPRGASFESMPQPIIKGGDKFRPVGLAVAPDGSMYVTDWVSKEYKLHGLGRVWRVSAVEPSKPASTTPPAAALAELPKDSPIPEFPVRLVERRLLARQLSQTKAGRSFLQRLLNDVHAPDRSRIEALWALANVATSVENLNLVGTGKLAPPFLQKTDVVGVAATELLGSGQLMMPQPVPEGFFGRELFFDHSGLGRIFTINITEFYLKTHNLASVGYFMGGGDPFLETRSMQKMARFADKDAVSNWQDSTSGQPTESYIHSLFLLARAFDPKNVTVVERGLHSHDNQIRRAAVQWVGEEKLKALRPEIDQVLASEPMTSELFMACLASLSLLDGVSPAEFEKAPPVGHIMPIIKDSKRSPGLRSIALRMVSPTAKELDGKLLSELATSNDEGLRREAVRTLALSPVAERIAVLRGIAANESLDPNLRADAVAGLAGNDPHAKLDGATRDLLITLATKQQNPSLQLEAIRTLRGPALALQSQPIRDAVVTDALKQLAASVSQQPVTSQLALKETLEFALGRRPARPVAEVLAEFSSPDGQKSGAGTDSGKSTEVEAGRRTFFHVNGAGCFKCHTVGGRGGQVGPDLTVIARTMDRKKLAESVLEPSKEISPQFTSWTIETTSGKVLSGILLGEEVNGDLRMGNNQGDVFFVPFKEIESRSPTKLSIMPEKLHEAMTATEFRNLIAFLETLK